MRLNHRKTVLRAGALMLALIAMLSFTASYAASFTKSGAGIKYGGKTFKLGDTTTPQKLKKTFGNWTSRLVNDGCTCGFATYLYTFKSKGVVIETLQKKQGGTEKIITITVTSSKVPTTNGLKVGNKTSTLAAKYGTKCKKSGSTVLYTSGKYHMYVFTKSKKITKIQFWMPIK